MQGFTADPVAIGLVPAVFMFFVILFTLVIMKYGDLYQNKSRMLAIGFLCRSVAWLSFTLIQSYIGLLVVQVILALGESTGSPAFETLVAEHLDNKKHVRDYSMWRIVSYFTAAISTLAGSFVIKYLGFNSLFVCMSAIAFLCFMYTLAKESKMN
jgi:MFS family permease